MTRIGVFGGTFDPPHLGHLLAATDAAEQLELDMLWFVPNATQPLKGAGQGSPTDRLEMVRRLVGPDPRLGVDALEIERDGLSFTVDTMSVFADRFPDATRFLLIGADVTATFGQWRDPRRIRKLAAIVIMERPGTDLGPSSATLMDPGGYLSGAPRLPTRRIEISSTEVRARVRSGKSIRGFVPDAVAEYIAAAGLYR